MPWQRPSTAPFPAVYKQYVGKKAMANGKCPKFRIQDAPPEMEDEVLDHMVTFFLKSEPMCSNRRITEDPVSVEATSVLWRDIYRQRMVLVALLEQEDGSTRLAGVNMTGISEVKDKDKVFQFDGLAINAVLHSVIYMGNLVNVFERYGVDEYMTAMGLSVAPEFQGQGLGLEILLARIPLCRATGVRLTATVFTAANSQELARRAGFETLSVVDYKDMKVDGKELFPGILVKSLKNMALKIE